MSKTKLQLDDSNYIEQYATITPTAWKVPQADGSGEIHKDWIQTGTSSLDILRLDGDAKIPAVDGSQITNLYESGDNFITIPSNNLKTSADANRITQSITYEKKKEILYNDIDGIITVSFTIFHYESGQTIYGRIYKNGVAAGTERSKVGTGDQVFTENISVEQGDLIQLYIKVGNASYTGGTNNFRLYYDKVAKPITNTVNLN